MQLFSRKYFKYLPLYRLSALEMFASQLDPSRCRIFENTHKFNLISNVYVKFPNGLGG